MTRDTVVADATLLHLCRLMLAQYPFPRLTREQLEGMASLEDVQPEALTRTRHADARDRLQAAESWFANAETLWRHVQTWRRRSRGRIVVYHEAAYPHWLRQVSNPPVALFCEGDVSLLDTPSVAIVGSRAASEAACRFTQQLAADLAQLGYGIVSGLARGIDAAAHTGALEVGGVTIAVVGNGTDVVYPAEHRGLQEQLCRRGCVISELPPGTAPRAWHFPSRNRILAGLTRGVIVVQAERRSGALITARHALEENREVMAVPGDVDDTRSRGAHALLRQGAALVETAADVVAVLGEEAAPPAAPHTGDDRQAVLAALQGPQSTDALRSVLDWPSARLQVAVSELEIMGWVIRDERGRIRRRGR